MLHCCRWSTMVFSRSKKWQCESEVTVLKESFVVMNLQSFQVYVSLPSVLHSFAASLRSHDHICASYIGWVGDSLKNLIERVQECDSLVTFLSHTLASFADSHRNNQALSWCWLNGIELISVLLRGFLNTFCRGGLKKKKQVNPEEAWRALNLLANLPAFLY